MHYLRGRYSLCVSHYQTYLTPTVSWPNCPIPNTGGIDVANARHHVIVNTIVAVHDQLPSFSQNLSSCFTMISRITANDTDVQRDAIPNHEHCKCSYQNDKYSIIRDILLLVKSCIKIITQLILITDLSAYKRSLQIDRILPQVFSLLEMYRLCPGIYQPQKSISRLLLGSTQGC